MTSKPMKSLQNWLPAAALSAILFLVYGSTMSLSIQEIDTGELATVQYLPGIAHPSGYPLFTFLGFAVVRTLGFAEPLLVSNALNLLMVVLGACFFFAALRTLHPKGNPWLMLLAVLSVFFSLRVWSQAVSLEVYGYHIGLLGLWTWLLIRYQQKAGTKASIWLGLSTGLLFSNHLISIVVVPGLLWALWKAHSTWKARLLEGGIMTGAGLAAALPLYAGLLLLAKQNPAAYFGDLSSLSGFWNHITGAQYRVWMFQGWVFSKENIGLFIKGLPVDLYWTLLPAALGLWFGRKSWPWLFIQLLVCVWYASNYDIPDIEPYYLSATLLLLFPVYAFFSYLSETVKPAWLILLPAALLPVLLLFKHGERANRRSDVLVERYARAALLSLPENALVITRQWDVFVSPSMYLQTVKNLRPDVVILDKELFRRPWYLHRGQQRHPEVWKGTEPALDSLLPKLKAFEEGDPNPQGIQQAFEIWIQELMRQNAGRRPVLLGPELVDEEVGRRSDVILPEGLRLVPLSYFYQLRSDTAYVPVSESGDAVADMPPGVLETESRIHRMVRQLRISMMANRFGYENYYGRVEEASRWRQRADQMRGRKSARGPVELPPQPK